MSAPPRTTDAAVISLRNVSKKYQLYDSLRHRVYEALHPFKRVYHREFWAVTGIDLEIPKGATVGILGVNGSGKSTLLQIICSILQPTSGTVEVRGRVAALIELGAGFNPQLTGRENAELNSIVMGLSVRDARARLQEIEKFADIREFFDQPVKTYSSGMVMRVAFATAINVDPDILVIDEALAVGDAKFQQKCFRKFAEFQSAGKTILLVTHDRFAVPRLCSFAVLLDRGRLLATGDPNRVTERYSELLALGDSVRGDAAGTATRPDRRADPGPGGADAAAQAGGGDPVERFLALPGETDRCSSNPTYNKNEFRYGIGGAAIIDYLLMVGEEANPAEIAADTVLDIYVRIRFDRDVNDPLVGLTVKSSEGVLVFATNSRWLRRPLQGRKRGDIVAYRFSTAMSLGAADWFIDVAVAATETEMLDNRESMIHVRTGTDVVTTGLAFLRTRIEEMN